MATTTKTATENKGTGKGTATTTTAPRRGRGRAAEQAPQAEPVKSADEQQPSGGAPVNTAEGEAQQQDAQEAEPIRIPAGMQLPEGVEARIYDAADLEPWPNLPTRDVKDYAADDPDMIELADSMEAHAAAGGLPFGNFEPIAVHPRPDGRGWIVAGRRRWTGAGLKGLKVLAIVREWTEAEAHVTALAENIHHKRISYLAEADEMALLRETFGMDQLEIGAKIGKGQSYVSKRLAVRAMPAWVRAAIDREELSPSVAYDGLGVYVAVPEPAASELWAQAERWYNSARQGGRRPTAEQIRQAVGDMAARLSRPMEVDAAYRGEEGPAFDAATHDAACACGRPSIAIQPMYRAHARCYAVPVWLRLQADAKEQRSRQIRERAGKAGGKQGGKTAAPAPAPLAPKAAEPEHPAPVAAAEPMDSPAPMLPAWDVPTWAEYMAGRDSRAVYCVAGDEAPENMRDTRRELLDWTALPVDALHYVLAPAGDGVFRIVCDDAEAIEAAREVAKRRVAAVAAVLREQAQAAFRKDVAAVDERSAAALAVVIYELPQAGRWFVDDTARALGIDFGSAATLDTVRKLPKAKLTLLFQGLAWRYLNKQTAAFHPDYDNQAARQVYEEQAADFAAVVDGLPKPEPTPAGRVQQLAGIVEARWADTQRIAEQREAGAFADELGEYGPEWRVTIAGFRAAVEAVTDTADAAGVDPARVANVHGTAAGTVADLLTEARELLAHPTIARVEAEAAPAAEPAEQPQDAEQAPAEGAPAEGAPAEGAPADEPGEAEPTEQPQGDPQAPDQEAAPAAEPAPDGVVRVEPGTRNVRGRGRGGRRK
ncbi:MAG: ParB/RepB/Spo0J family partition protein [Gemmatimonadetes bacterium]|nr:ParB/RepB/Spo0J family partition protein [Gemmatimonadota bacterium]